MTGIREKCFGTSGIFRGLYICAVLFFGGLCSYRTALILSSKPGFALCFVLFMAFAFAFLIFSKYMCKKDARAASVLRLMLVACFCTCAIGAYVPVEKSIAWIFIFALWYFFLRYGLKQESSGRVSTAALALGLLFSLFVFFGSQLKDYERLEILYVLGEPLSLLEMLFSLAAQTLMFTLCLNTVFAAILARDLSAPGQERPGIKKQLAVVLLLSCAIFLCYLPYYYAFYPGNISPDSIYEMEMQLGIKPLSNHHPYIHQLIIGLCLRLGGNSIELGVGIYSLIQMLLLSVVFGFCVFFLGRLGVNKYIQAGAFCFFAFFPVNGFYSVTMWKDVFYGAVCLAFMMLLVVQGTEGGKKGLGFYISLALAGVCFCIFRNNGWYAFLLGFPVYILCNRKQWKRLCVVFALVVLLVSGYNHLIFDTLGLKKSGSGEMLSVPLQQIARTVKNDPDVINDEDIAAMWEVFPELDKLGDLYNPHISDPVKAGNVFMSERFNADPVKYLKSWAKIGIKHPVTYVEAFLLQCYGYWYPDVEYWIVHNDIEANELGLEMRPERNGIRFGISMLTRDISQSEPTAILFSLGLMVWLMIIAATLLILKGQGSVASPIFILGGLWLTTLASPVYCEYRYMYGFVVCVPLFLGLALGLKSRKT